MSEDAPVWPTAAGEFLSGMLHGRAPEPGPPWTHTFGPPEPVILTSADPEPPPGTRVLDHGGTEWYLDEDSGYWWVEDDENGDGDPESWTKVAGNYGPVTVLEWGGDDGPLYPAPSFTIRTGEILPPSEPVTITGEFCPECERESAGYLARPHAHDDARMRCNDADSISSAPAAQPQSRRKPSGPAGS